MNDLQFQVEGGSQLSGNMDAAPGISQAQEAQVDNAIALRNSAHPSACIFHVLFKGVALFLYIFGGWFSSNGKGGTSGAHFITVTVFCILLLAADFWVVKNITGRLLVGLRWWNQVEGDTTRWIFESKGEEGSSNKVDSTIFWTVLYVTPLIWGSLFLLGLLKLQVGWLLVVSMALSLSLANVYGYYKCSSDQKAKFQQMTQEYAQRGVMTAMRGNLFGMLIGGSGNSGGGGQPAQQQTFT
mmetsp:Transcript_21881/g.36134  ORF Transcript_21881/g.36134 Transcript_21881/m.36134 type:complete len:241 (-) Transcript_21881:151-873(-)|eukprot:CAMPEP_0119004306 /NCGR_PEP_ID=MMETSP1176-20130426/1065_1 /TAXON_ID=265551 /ORGANISM="Synedropsis recta cf, Strain CCMP1620" /LENGTH=240 /DNA_ID=CAMNT_0006955995 /DNA_START=95 /DNA_END=817 /DNA_ORIENTATION=+